MHSACVELQSLLQVLTASKQLALQIPCWPVQPLRQLVSALLQLVAHPRHCVRSAVQPALHWFTQAALQNCPAAASQAELHAVRVESHCWVVWQPCKHDVRVEPQLVSQLVFALPHPLSHTVWP